LPHPPAPRRAPARCGGIRTPICVTRHPRLRADLSRRRLTERAGSLVVSFVLPSAPGSRLLLAATSDRAAAAQSTVLGGRTDRSKIGGPEIAAPGGLSGPSQADGWRLYRRDIRVRTIDLVPDNLPALFLVSASSGGSIGRNWRFRWSSWVEELAHPWRWGAGCLLAVRCGARADPDPDPFGIDRARTAVCRGFAAVCVICS